ncbi:hypothetical protein NQ317_001937 [Molorchus minor]|uniref:C-type lectin domain-containing protein n=1 Tax=Molorchus minor TaxID=1323400 RepID=A0ABQ9JDB7_9CUCU|nr:hypothetical protein NQ317_001937 [Molorchus minor]
MGMHVIFLIVASLFAGTLALANSNAFAVSFIHKTRHNTDQATDSSMNNTDQTTDPYWNNTDQAVDPSFNNTDPSWTNTDEAAGPSFASVHYGRKTYYIESILQANYFQAFQYCRYHGMQLLTISSQAEADFLGRQVENLGKHSFWTSGSKLSDQTNWSWMSTGSQINYTNWHSGEPTMENEDCIEMKMYDNGGLKWNDASCSNRNNFICETFSTRNCFDLMAELLKTSTTVKITTRNEHESYPVDVL